MSLILWVFLRFFAPGHPEFQESITCYSWITCSMTTGICLDDALCHTKRQDRTCWSPKDFPSVEDCFE